MAGPPSLPDVIRPAKEQQMTPRLFAIVGTDLSVPEIQQLAEKLRVDLSAWLGVQVEITDSQTWYSQRFATSGNWDAWIWDTVLSRDYSTRKPFFDGFVVCEELLGRAGAGIVSLALRNQRLVLHWKDQALIQNVVGVDPVGSDWKSGFSVRSAPIGG